MGIGIKSFYGSFHIINPRKGTETSTSPGIDSCSSGFHIINPRKGTETAIAIYIHLQVSDYLIPARGLKGCKMRIIKTHLASKKMPESATSSNRKNPSKNTPLIWADDTELVSLVFDLARISHK